MMPLKRDSAEVSPCTLLVTHVLLDCLARKDRIASSNIKLSEMASPFKLHFKFIDIFTTTKVVPQNAS